MVPEWLKGFIFPQPTQIEAVNKPVRLASSVGSRFHNKSATKVLKIKIKIEIPSLEASTAPVRFNHIAVVDNRPGLRRFLISNLQPRLLCECQD
jgi:hypothetical protein